MYWRMHDTRKWQQQKKTVRHKQRNDLVYCEREYQRPTNPITMHGLTFDSIIGKQHTNLLSTIVSS